MYRYIFLLFLILTICVQAIESSVRAERIFPYSFFIQGQEEIKVKIQFTGESDSTIVEETIPPGWTVNKVRQGTVNGRTIRWEVTSSWLTRGIEYYVHVPSSPEGDAHFSGTVNDEIIGGDCVMEFRRSIPTPGKQVPMYSSLYNYWLYLPPEYTDQEGQWPLILFLHGMCMIGTDLSIVLTHYDYSPLTILGNPDHEELFPELFQSIVIAPQSTTAIWDTETLYEFLIELFSTYSIDTNRVYLYGHAGGADAGWIMANEYPDLLAAFYSGGMLTNVATNPPRVTENIAGLPVWLFEAAIYHSTQVQSVVDNLVNELRAYGGECKLTFMPYNNAFKEADIYFDPELYKWLLNQNKQERLSGLNYWHIY